MSMDAIVRNGKAHERPFPSATEVVVIGGGVAGVSTAYFLAKAGIPVVLLEKGRIAGEQSSRNWGWIRKQGRDPRELPAAILALRLWADIANEIGTDIGWSVGGVTYLAQSDSKLGAYEAWMEHARAHQLDSRLLSAADVDGLLAQTGRRFKGAITTPSDARAEPKLAIPALAKAAASQDAQIFERVAVRSLDIEKGRVVAVLTERGRIACNSVVLAGGAWCSLFLRHLGLNFPQLKVRASVQRTEPAPLITESAVGADGASFRRRADGGYTLAKTGAATFDITPAAFRHAKSFLSTFASNRNVIKLRFGRAFFEEFAWRSDWTPDQETPFERHRVLDPEPDHALLDDVLANTGDLFPQLRGIKAVERWAGMIDVTPDEIPVLGPVDGVPGLLIATGFSGHGFGLGPAAGHVSAALAQGQAPLVDLHAFRFSRFAERSGIRRLPAH